MTSEWSAYLDPFGMKFPTTRELDAEISKKENIDPIRDPTGLLWILLKESSYYSVPSSDAWFTLSTPSLSIDVDSFLEYSCV